MKNEVKIKHLDYKRQMTIVLPSHYYKEALFRKKLYSRDGAKIVVFTPVFTFCAMCKMHPLGTLLTHGKLCVFQSTRQKHYSVYLVSE